MRNAKAIGRLAGMAVGLGIGVALAATPGTASADDMQISIGGLDLFPTAGNTATASSGMGDIAIAIGNGSFADAGAADTPGQSDFAFANGTDSIARAANGNSDSAVASGNITEANAVGGNSNIALVSGYHSEADAGNGNFDTANLLNGTDSITQAGGGNFDSASGFGPHTDVEAGSVGTAIPSNFDTALGFDPFGTEGSLAEAGAGNFDLAAFFGDGLHATATGGNFLVDILP